MKRNLLSLFVLLTLLLAGLPTQPARAAGTTHYVDADVHCSAFCGSSWLTAYPSLQTALAAAVSGDQIWVAEGVYYPGAAADRAATFTLKIGVKVYGGFNGTETRLVQRKPTVHLTILSGDIDKNDIDTDRNSIAETHTDIQGANAYHVVTGGGTDSTAILDGFIITAGKADGAFPHDSGGGMRSVSSSPTLANLDFSGNYASSSGGGMSNLSDSSPSITDVSFHGNYAGSYGGGMKNEARSNPNLRNITFVNNSCVFSGGGMANFENSLPVLEGVTFTGNEANSGGGMYNDDSDPTVTNATFSGNTATDVGGGMVNRNNSFPSLYFVTISDNTAPASGGMYNSANSHPILHGVLIANHSNGDCDNEAGGYLDAASSHNLIETGAHACGLTNGDPNGNVTGSDPNLAPLSDNGGATETHALLDGSPAIDAGDDAACPETDQRGSPRPTGLYCDIGAYEMDPPPTIVSITRADASPTNAASVDFDITFSEPVDNVHDYDFQVTVTSGTITGAVVTGITGNNTSGTVTVSTGMGDGTLRLDVPAGVGIVDMDGNPLEGLPYTSGEEYEINKATPILLSPSIDEVLNTNRPTFDWMDFSGATLYQIQVSRNTSFSPLAFSKTSASSTYTPTINLTGSQLHYWRVRAKVGGAYGPWSDTWTFTTGNPPSVPVLTAPGNNKLMVGPSPLFDWKDVTVPSGVTLKNYQIQIASDAAFSTVVHSSAPTLSQCDYAVLTGGKTYYWRVRSVSTNLDYSAWSAVRMVKIKYDAPTLLTPTDASTVGGLLPTFMWNATLGATSYTIQLSKEADMAPTVLSKMVNTPTYTATVNLLPATTYYWRVRANGPYGPSAYSLVFSFTTP